MRGADTLKKKERGGGMRRRLPRSINMFSKWGWGKKGDPFSWPHKCRSAVVSRAGDAAANVAHLVRVARPP